MGKISEKSKLLGYTSPDFKDVMFFLRKYYYNVFINKTNELMISCDPLIQKSHVSGLCKPLIHDLVH